MTRKEINSRAHALAHGKLHMDAATFKAIVANEDPASEGHISRCSDETAAVVLGRLEGELKARAFHGKETLDRQHSMIPHLMEHLKWDWKATADFCRRITGKGNTRGCSVAELSKVIRGMIAIVDKDLEAGKIVMTHTEKFNYDRFTKNYRNREAA